jgi:hypothetical protein
MLSPLAKTVFSTSVDDKLATVDVYTETSATAPTDTTAAATNDPASVAGFLGVDQVAAIGPDNAISEFDPNLGTPLTSTDLTTGIIAKNPSLNSSFAQLDSSLKAMISKVNSFSHITLTDVTIPGLPPSITNAANASNINGLLGMVNSVCGVIQDGVKILEDVAGTIALLGNLINAAANLKIPNVYARFDDGCFSASIMGPVTKTSLKVAVSTSDLSLLANISNGSQASNAKAMYPTFCSQFASNFKLAPNTPPAAHAQIGLDISSAFGKIDATWASGRAGSNVMVNAGLFVNASPDFHAVMAASAISSRPPYNRTSVSSAVAISSIIPISSRPPRTTQSSYVDNTGIPHTVYGYPDGTRQDYALPPEAVNSTLITTSPAPITNDSLAHLDNSAINDPMTLGYGFDKCMNGGDAPPPIDNSLGGTYGDPSLNASASLSNNFPLTTFGTLSDTDPAW